MIHKLIDGMIAVLIFLVCLWRYDVFEAWEFVKDYWIFGEWQLDETLEQHEGR